MGDNTGVFLSRGELAMLWMKGVSVHVVVNVMEANNLTLEKIYRTSVSPKAQSTNESEARTLRPMSRLREAAIERGREKPMEREREREPLGVLPQSQTDRIACRHVRLFLHSVLIN